MTAQILHGDCLDVMRTLEKNSVDAVITDPPYGVNYVNKRHDIKPHKQFAKAIDNDDTQDVGQRVIDYCRSVGVPVCAFAHHRHPWRGDWRQHLVWDKGPCVGGGGDRATCWKFTWELIQVAGFGALNGKRESAVLKHYVSQADYKYHPTQKPLSLMRYLIEKLTRPGDLVFDPFCGSGSTGVACVELDRRFIGVELNPEYAAIARQRIAAARAETPLFAEAEGTR